MKFLANDKLEALLGGFATENRVVAPIRDAEGGPLLFRPWEPGAPIDLDTLLAKQSPKSYIFKQSETYLKFGYKTEGDARAIAPEAARPAQTIVAVDPVNEAPKQVIFGLRPCDVRGFVQMDQVFGGYGGFYFDPYYNAKREATTLVAVACAKPRSTCFCTSVGGHPAGTEGVDVLLTPVEGGFTVEALTEKGEALVTTDLLQEASQQQEAYAETVKEHAESRIRPAFGDLTHEEIQGNMKANFEDPEWANLAARCISCGTCTYVCPNCYCFNITDEVVEGSGERTRTWDNCFNPTYTLETSGHNPRDVKMARFRNRFSHKFWYYPEKYDSLLCSGCGRCISGCPVRIDLREVVRTMGAARPVLAEVATGGEA
jgi:sulfhydrogenase subunit beta (sulfur reductase)